MSYIANLKNIISKGRRMLHYDSDQILVVKSIQGESVKTKDAIIVNDLDPITAAVVTKISVSAHKATLHFSDIKNTAILIIYNAENSIRILTHHIKTTKAVLFRYKDYKTIMIPYRYIDHTTLKIMGQSPMKNVLFYESILKDIIQPALDEIRKKELVDEYEKSNKPLNLI